MKTVKPVEHIITDMDAGWVLDFWKINRKRVSKCDVIIEIDGKRTVTAVYRITADKADDGTIGFSKTSMVPEHPLVGSTIQPLGHENDGAMANGYRFTRLPLDQLPEWNMNTIQAYRRFNGAPDLTLDGYVQLMEPYMTPLPVIRGDGMGDIIRAWQYARENPSYQPMRISLDEMRNLLD